MRKDIIIIICGWFFIALGIAGLFLPILQGVLFIFIGLYLLSKKVSWAKKLLHKFERRYPSIFRKIDGARNRADRYIIRMERYINRIRRKA